MKLIQFTHRCVGSEMKISLSLSLPVFHLMETFKSANLKEATLAVEVPDVKHEAKLRCCWRDFAAMCRDAPRPEPAEEAVLMLQGMKAG